MNRDKLFEFVQKYNQIYIYGKGKDLEGIHWYLSNNSITFRTLDRISVCMVEEGNMDRIGIIILMSDPDINEYMIKLELAGYKNFFFASAAALRELRCIYSIKTPNDQIEAELLLDAYHRGSLDKDLIRRCTYTGLMYIKCFCDNDTYKNIHNAVCDINRNEIRKKDKVSVGFLIKHSSEWSAEQIYRRMQLDNKYHPVLLIAPYHVGTKQAVMDNYSQTVRYFEENGYSYIAMYNVDTEQYVNWHEDVECDIIFNLTPNFIWLKKSSCIVKFPLSILNVYIPYGYYISGLVESQFNQLSHAMFWKIFCESKLHKQMAEKYSDIGGVNVDFSGYLKMDTFYNREEVDSSRIWSESHAIKSNTRKKIIYAPHWSIGNSKTAYGSFEKIYEKIYELAKNTYTSISWIIKPHPRLRSECVVQGVFRSEKEYDEYLGKWDMLPNARAVTCGVYDDIFKTSDGMVLDSISFLAEYMYVDKPMIFITRPEQTVNEFGVELMKVLYKAEGNKFDELKGMIEDVICNGKDFMKDKRKAFFDEYLDYVKENGVTAAEHIMKIIEG